MMMTNECYDNDSISYLLNYALDNGISFETTYLLEPTTPSCSDTKKRKMVINMNANNKELPFQIAHEIGHILNKDRGVQYFSLDNVTSPKEVDANKTGIKILANYYFDEIPLENWNPDVFFKYYKIPNYYKDWFINYMKQNTI